MFPINSKKKAKKIESINPEIKATNTMSIFLGLIGFSRTATLPMRAVFCSFCGVRENSISFFWFFKEYTLLAAMLSSVCVLLISIA